MKWKAPATEPSPDCRPLHEVHATAKDDQGHAWSNGEYAARGRNGRDYAWACHPLPAPQPEMTRTRVLSRLLHKRTMNMMPPCGGEFRHWPPSYPATGIRSTTPKVFRQWTGPRDRMFARRHWKKFFFSPCSGGTAPVLPQTGKGKAARPSQPREMPHGACQKPPVRCRTRTLPVPRHAASARYAPLSTRPAASGILAPPARCRNENIGGYG